MVANPHLFPQLQKAKQNRSAVEKLLEPTAHWFLRNCPGRSWKAELPGQGGTQPDLRTEGKKVLGEMKEIKKKDKALCIYGM